MGIFCKYLKITFHNLGKMSLKTHSHSRRCLFITSHSTNADYWSIHTQFMHFFKMWRKKVEEAVAIGKKAIRDHWLYFLCMFFMFIFLLPGNKLLLKFQLKAAHILLSHRFYRSEGWTGINCFKVSAGYNQCQLQLHSHQRFQLGKRFTSKILHFVG